MLRNRAPQPSIEVGCCIFSACIAQCTFPDDRNSPSKLQQLLPVVSVADGIAFELCLPILRVRRWRRGETATGVSMPEATVHEAHRVVFPENQVWRSWKAFVMQSVPKPPAVHRPTEKQLRSAVLRTYPGHCT